MKATKNVLVFCYITGIISAFYATYNLTLSTMHPIYRTGYSPEYAFYIFSQQIYYLIIFLDFHHLCLFFHKMSCIS